MEYAKSEYYSHGPPGTGKTYETLFLAVELTTGKRPADIHEADAIFK